MSSDPALSIEGTAALILEEQRRIDAVVRRKIVPHPAATRVLMIGPHPDDNLFGPGGTAIKYQLAGIAQFWVCLTDGRACVADPAERERMHRERGAEERACASFLGIPEPELFDFPEDQLTLPEHERSLAQRLARSLLDKRPDALFVPYFLENHPLHRYTNHLAALALRDYPHECTVYAWAVASFPPPSIVVDITQEFPRKLEAARLYRTQMSIYDYSEQLTALARLNSIYGPPGSLYCDRFFAQGKSEFVREMLARGLNRRETLGVGVQPMLPEKS